MVVALAGLLVALGSTPTAEPRVDLTWKAPAPCPDAAVVHERLRALAPDLPPGPTVRADATIVARPGSGWRMRLALHGPGLADRRTIDARDCRSLADVTALLLALAVAPEAVATRAVAAAQNDPTSPAPPLPPPARSPPASSSPPSTRDSARPAGAPGRPDPHPAGAPDHQGLSATPDARASARPGRAPDLPDPTADPFTRASAHPSGAPGHPDPSADPSTRASAHSSGAPGHPNPAADPSTRASAPPSAPDARASAHPSGAPDSPSPAPDPGARLSARKRAPSPLRGAVRLGFAGDYGSLSTWSPAGTLAVGLFGRAWRVEIQGTYAARRLNYPEQDGVGGRLLLAAGAVRGCGVPRWRQLEFPVCGGVELGLMRGVGRGVADPRPANDLWLALQLGPGLAWAPTRHLALTAGLDLLVALRRPGFHVAALPELARARPVGVRPMIGLEFRFP